MFDHYLKNAQSHKECEASLIVSTSALISINEADFITLVTARFVHTSLDLFQHLLLFQPTSTIQKFLIDPPPTMHAQLYESVKPLDSVVHFLTVVLKELGWFRQKEELVMDVGCGPGHVTFQFILPLFSDVEKFVAVDYSPSMIDTARCNNFHPKIEYHVADFENKSELKRWHGQVTKLVSIHCVNWLKNQKQSFQNAYDLLQPGGEAAFYFVLISDFYAAVVDIYKDPKWSNYFQGVDSRVPESHSKKYDSTYYRKMVEDIGFDVLLCQDELKVNPLASELEAKDLYYSLTVLVHHVPQNLKDEFRNDLYDYVVKNGGITEDGILVHRAVTLELVVRKPGNESKLLQI